MIECILFDSDGTLVDSEPLSFDVLVEMFASLGADLDSEQLHLDYRGWKMGEVIGILASRSGLDLPEGFEQEFRRQQIERFETDLRPVPGVTELLQALGQATAVVTSGPLPKVRKALAVTGLERFFGENIYSAWEVGVFKPDPEIYRIAARGMGFPIGRCLAVEDSPIGLEAAATCGAVPVFLNRYGDRIEYGNVIEISSMEELPDVIARL